MDEIPPKVLRDLRSHTELERAAISDFLFVMCQSAEIEYDTLRESSPVAAGKALDGMIAYARNKVSVIKWLQSINSQRRLSRAVIPDQPNHVDRPPTSIDPIASG